MSFYNNLEKRFDELTPDWIVPTGMIIQDFANEEKLKWQLAIQFKKRIVRKASPIKGDDGDIFWNPIDAKVGIPDFVVMSSEQYEKYRAMIDRYFSGQKCVDPFRHLDCKSGFYIEVFGERYHSGDFVRGFTKEEHEDEVTRAYESAGAKLLILWEDDINKRWKEVCLPKIKKFLEKSEKIIDLYSWDQKKEIKNNCLSSNSIQSLNNAQFWRNLSDYDQEIVVNELIDCYSSIEYPFPDINMSKYDFVRFISWSKKGSKKGTRFGKDCCLHFVRSIIHAKVRGQKSKYDLWHDKEIMRKSILWQLRTENGSHHATRFMNAMCYKSGFRSISNLSPARVVQWCRSYGVIQKNGLFYDSCAGWGSRMLAAHAMNMEYIGIDANKVLVDELNKMASNLGLNAKVFYGDSADREFVMFVLNGRKIDLSFTSPPYFNKEIYSNDPIQSIQQFPKENDWYLHFASRMIKNTVDFLSENGIGLINISESFNVEKMIGSIKEINFEDFEVYIESSKGLFKERLVKFSKNIKKNEIENLDYVICNICHKRFKRISRHLRSHHKIGKDEYLKMFPGAKLISKNDSDRVKKENKRKGSGRKYKQRVVYRIPDGSIVKKKDSWIKAWGIENPPEDSIVDASTVNLDPWKDKIEGIDYVICKVCGYKGRNITRHVRREHKIDTYDGMLKSENCKKALSNASLLAWKTKKKIHKIE